MSAESASAPSSRPAAGATARSTRRWSRLRQPVLHLALSRSSFIRRRAHDPRPGRSRRARARPAPAPSCRGPVRRRKERAPLGERVAHARALERPQVAPQRGRRCPDSASSAIDEAKAVGLRPNRPRRWVRSCWSRRSSSASRRRPR